MIYPNNGKAIIMGRDGFIGSQLAKRDLVPGVYFFDSPSSIVLFNENMDMCMRKTLNDFIEVLGYCRDHNLYLVFPSSATVINKNTAYARCKAACEELYYAYGIPALGLRIAAGYGPAEAHKGSHASVIYQWTKGMLKGERPVIYGDGTQTRDFIYQDDLIDAIKELSDNHITGIHEIGTGINTSFNDVVKTINAVLGTKIEPIYVPKPKQYVQDTPVKPVSTKFTLHDGIRAIAQSLQ